MPDDRWSIVEIRTGVFVGVDEEHLTPEEVRSFAGELLDAAVRVEHAARGAEIDEIMAAKERERG